MRKSTPIFTLKVDKDAPNLVTLPKEELGEALLAMQKLLEAIFGAGNVYAELNMGKKEDGEKTG